MRIGVIIPVTKTRDTETLPTFTQLRDFAQHAEGVSIDSAWVFDHLYAGYGDVPPDQIHEAWTVLSAIAATTSRIELGQLVTCVSFRSPALLAKMAVTVDEISGGRLTLGIGAGWYDREYHDFGFPIDHRGTRFDEALKIMLPLLRGEQVTFEGKYHQVRDVALLPPPSRRIPLLIAGQRPRMRGLIAQHADAWNTAWYPEPNDVMHGRMAEMRASMDEAGREHSSLRWTIGMASTNQTVDELAAAMRQFQKVGADDLIISLGTVDTKALDRVAEARTLM
jgi:probable F420-dependent oxidoreductase